MVTHSHAFIQFIERGKNARFNQIQGSVYIIKHCCINNSYQLNTLIGKDYDDYGYCLKSLNKDYIISLNNDLGFIGLKQ